MPFPFRDKRGDAWAKLWWFAGEEEAMRREPAPLTLRSKVRVKKEGKSG
jgi:hypothetical protein